MTEARTCGRPTKQGKPCGALLYGPQARACRLHETPEDIAYREGYATGLKDGSRQRDGEREYWIDAGRRQERADLERAEADKRALAAFRLKTDDGGQLVIVDDRYTYRWDGEPLQVGDRVLLPENWLSAVKHGHGPFPGVITSLGSAYQGELSRVIRKIGSGEGERA